MEHSFVILVMIDIVDSTKTTERLGDYKMSQKMRLYDRISRGLLIKWNGLEIDRTDGYLLLFENMREALEYSTEYHKLVEQHLGFTSRIGIHAGIVIMHSNDTFFVSRGAKPIEIEGIQKSVCARIMSLARGGQTLLSNRAGQIAMSIRGKLKMADIGKWTFKGVKKPMQLYAISWDIHRLKRPKGNQKVQMVSPPKLTPEEQRKQNIRRYVIYPMLLATLVWGLQLLVILRFVYPFNQNLVNLERFLDFLPQLLEFDTYINFFDWISKWLHRLLSFFSAP